MEGVEHFVTQTMDQGFSAGRDDTPRRVSTPYDEWTGKMSVRAPMGADLRDLTGRVIGSKYRLNRFIGAGGMGTIYEGTDVTLHRTVAVKLLSASLMEDQKSVQRFQREGKAASRLNHRNIVSVYDFGMHNDEQPYLVMEYVVGESLSSVLARQKTLPIEEALTIKRQICQALEHAHEHGVVHRDLKPGNVLITKDKVVKIVDFGIAKIASDECSQVLTSSGEIFGSPLYMSPEQAAGFSLDGRSDIYSLGCLLYECLTSIPPHVGESPLVTISKHQQEEPLSLKEASLGHNFPPDLETIVAKMLAKQPIDRYQTAAAAEFEITNLLDGKAYQEASDERELTEAEKFQQVQAVSSFRHFQNLRQTAEKDEIPQGVSLKTKLLIGSGVLLLLIFLCLVAFQLFGQTPVPAPKAVKEFGVPITKEEKDQEELTLKDKEKADNPLARWNLLITHPRLSDMHGLEMDSMQVPADGWSFLTRMKKLQWLDASTTSFSANDIQFVLSLPLRSLDLSAVKGLHDQDIQKLGVMSNLRILFIRDDSLTDDSLKNLPANLTDIDCSGNTVRGPGLTYLTKLKHLSALTMRRCGLGEKMSHATARSYFLQLTQCKNLRYLDMRQNFVPPDVYEEFRRTLPNCLVLDSFDKAMIDHWEKSNENKRKK